MSLDRRQEDRLLLQWVGLGSELPARGEAAPTVASCVWNEAGEGEPQPRRGGGVKGRRSSSSLKLYGAVYKWLSSDARPMLNVKNSNAASAESSLRQVRVLSHQSEDRRAYR